MSNIKTCDYCNSELSSKNDRARYCSNKCRTADYYERQIEQAAIRLLSERGGEVLTAAIEQAIHTATAPLLADIRNLEYRIELSRSVSSEQQ